MSIVLAALLTVGAPADKLFDCAAHHVDELAFKEPTEAVAVVVETALQLCYEQNMDAQNAFRQEARLADPNVTADALVAQWEVRRSALRNTLVARVEACRTPGQGCPR